MAVGLRTLTLVAGTTPNDTLAPAPQLVPRIVTGDPPRVARVGGTTAVTVGVGPTNVNTLPDPIDVSGLVTMTFERPGTCAGAVTRICAELRNVTPVAGTPSNVTVAPGWNCAPL